MEVPGNGNLHFIIMKKLLTISLLAALFTVANAESSLGESVLAELESLRKEVSALTERVQTLEKHINSGGAAESEPGILERLTDAMNEQKVATHYPWMEESLWNEVENGMSPEDVIAILGEPSMTDPSLHKRIDTVMTYRGRHPGTGKKVTGKVKFYRGVVVAIEKPQ